MQRTFIIGDKWLYYKIYSGVKTADLILTDIILPVSSKLVNDKLIDKWFFIRYADPKNHIRWRLHLNENINIGDVIDIVYSSCKPYISTRLIHLLQTDTYKRELERYGPNSIELTETLFWNDSVTIVEMINLIEGDEGEKIRWLFSMRAIDQLLHDFHYKLQQKVEILKTLAENFENEFNINSSLIKQLSEKYRKEKKDINYFMDKKNDIKSPYLPLFQLLDNKSKKSLSVISEILSHHNNMSQKPLDNLLGSYIHMLMNRLFRSKQRLHEMVIYGFLFRYYSSELAKIKYKKQ
ncbi:MAG: thiopeptide-type bacteriocin biosynthesis protein [Bacteroidales bacterium]